MVHGPAFRSFAPYCEDDAPPLREAEPVVGGVLSHTRGQEVGSRPSASEGRCYTALRGACRSQNGIGRTTPGSRRVDEGKRE
jgi:hypothetical protein